MRLYALERISRYTTYEIRATGATARHPTGRHGECHASKETKSREIFRGIYCVQIFLLPTNILGVWQGPARATP